MNFTKELCIMIPLSFPVKLMEKSSYWPFRKEFTESNSIPFIIMIDELTPKLKNEEI